MKNLRELTFRVEPVQNTLLNLRGWRIVRSDGSVLLPFTTKREAEKLIDFFAPQENMEAAHDG